MKTALKKQRLPLFFLGVALLFPLFTDNQYFIYVVGLSFIYAIAVFGLNLIGGYTGQLSLAHAGFFAIGAYSLGLLTVDGGVPYWLAFLLALIITTVAGTCRAHRSAHERTFFRDLYALCWLYYLPLYL